MSDAFSPVRITVGRLAPDRVVEVVLGGTPFVSVMQTADFRNRNNLADRLNWPRIW